MAGASGALGARAHGAAVPVCPSCNASATTLNQHPVASSAWASAVAIVSATHTHVQRMSPTSEPFSARGSTKSCITGNNIRGCRILSQVIMVLFYIDIYLYEIEPEHGFMSWVINKKLIEMYGYY